MPIVLCSELFCFFVIFFVFLNDQKHKETGRDGTVGIASAISVNAEEVPWVIIYIK